MWRRQMLSHRTLLATKKNVKAEIHMKGFIKADNPFEIHLLCDVFFSLLIFRSEFYHFRWFALFGVHYHTMVAKKLQFCYSYSHSAPRFQHPTCENLIFHKKKRVRCVLILVERVPKVNNFFFWHPLNLDDDDDQRRAHLSMAKAYPIFHLLVFNEYRLHKHHPK